MKLKIAIILFSASFSSIGQVDFSLLKLIQQTNTFFQEHLGVHPDFGMVSLKKHHLTLSDMAKLGMDTDEAFSKNKDSVHSSLVVDYYAFQINKNIEEILELPIAVQLDFLDKFDPEYSHCWVSDDGKFAQISYYSNNGGSHYMQETFLIYKTDTDSLIFAHLNGIRGSGQKSIFENFHKDGYGGIHEIKEDGTTKYVLLGGVKACSTCYMEWISLVHFNDNNFVFDFNLDVGVRNFSESIEYDSDKKEIKVNYKTSDLTETCACALIDDTADYIDLEAEAAVTPDNTSCYCHFIYNGKTFELYEGIISPPDDED